MTLLTEMRAYLVWTPIVIHATMRACVNIARTDSTLMPMVSVFPVPPTLSTVVNMETKDIVFRARLDISFPKTRTAQGSASRTKSRLHQLGLVPLVLQLVGLASMVQVPVQRVMLETFNTQTTPAC